MQDMFYSVDTLGGVSMRVQYRSDGLHPPTRGTRLCLCV